MVKKCFWYIYFLFSIFLILAPLVGASVLNFVVLGFCFVLVYFLLRKKQLFLEKIFNCRVVNILIVIAILLRICLIFIPVTELYSDYANFFNSAVLYSETGTVDKYRTVFPHLIPYIVTLGTIFKMFGVKYAYVVILNIIFDLLGAFVLGKIFNTKKATLIWLINPINIIWCGFCHPSVITNSLLIISILILKFIFSKCKENIKMYLLFILFGVILAIANLFRPIMVILVIALIIYFILKLDKKTLKQTVLILLIVLISYFGSNKLFTFATKEFINDNISTQTFGWNIYVGANIESSGTWNREQQDEFDEIFSSDATPTEIQEHFFDKGIDLYVSNGLFNNIKLFVKKGLILVKNYAELSSYVFSKTFADSFNGVVFFVLKILMLVAHYLLLIFNLIIAYIKLKNKEWDFSILLQLFVIGIVTSHIFVEVSARYTLVLFVAYSLLLIMNWKNIYKFLNK